MVLTLLVIGMVLGGLVGFGAGWAVNGFYRAHLDIKRVRAGMPGMRRHRRSMLRRTFTPVFWAAVLLLVAWAVLTHPGPPHPAGPPRPGPTRPSPTHR